MHQDTKRDLIENGAGAIASLLKDVLVHQSKMDAQTELKEKELELARLRANADSPDNAATGDTQATPSSEVQVTEGVAANEPVTATPAEIDAAIDELIAEEMCAVCQDLLHGLKDRPVAEQVRGIKEYGSFKRELADDADVEQLKAVIQETDVLHAIFQEKFTGPAANP